MKTGNWPALIIGSYVIINLILIYGLFALAFPGIKIQVDDLLVFSLIVTGVLLLTQIFMFAVKVPLIEERPVAKRNIQAAAIFGSLLMAVLTFTAFICLFLWFLGENSPSPKHEDLVTTFLIVLFFGSWFFWAYSFLTTYKENLPGVFLRNMVQKLMIGSVAELIIAIQCHIIFRSRGDCCAPIFSYFGILMGTTVLLLAFGPGILFLYLKRINDKRPKSERS